MRYVTAGESHGPALFVIIEGVPAGIPLSQDDLDRDLARRQMGYGRGGRMAIERDVADVQSGIRHGLTLGTPVGIRIVNRDWENWTDRMAAFGEPTGERETAPRPGHADLAGVQKIGSGDCRDILERASARETAARVAAGAVARALLAQCGVAVGSAVMRIGSIEADLDIAELAVGEADTNDVRCPDVGAADRMRAEIDAAREDGESLGGTFVVWADGLVPGIGGYATGEDRLDGRLAGALVSIPAIKGVGIGDGFELAQRRGSEAHDEIVSEGGVTRRRTNRAGGIEGGMTNGERLVLLAAMKPIPTLMRPLASIDLDSGAAVDASKERSDVCAVPAAAVVAEAEVALVLADAYLGKFGGDCVGDLRSALDAYRGRLTR